MAKRQVSLSVRGEVAISINKGKYQLKMDVKAEPLDIMRLLNMSARGGMTCILESDQLEFDFQMSEDKTVIEKVTLKMSSDKLFDGLETLFDDKLEKPYIIAKNGLQAEADSPREAARQWAIMINALPIGFEPDADAVSYLLDKYDTSPALEKFLNIIESDMFDVQLKLPDEASSKTEEAEVAS